MNERIYEILLYKITANVILKIMELNNWSENETIERFMSSKLYSLLEEENTKMWHYSSLMLAQLFIDEQNGKLSLPEV